jgi:hypothetical protein
MSIALTDALIALSAPSCRIVFKRDPEAFLKGRNLSPEEISALLTGDIATIWRLARSTTSTDPQQQFNRYAKMNDILFEIADSPVEAEPMVEPNEEHDLVAVNGLGQMAVDEDGRYYLIVSDEAAN